MLFLKNLIYVIVLPGTVSVLVPYLLLARNHTGFPEFWGAQQYLGLPLALLGISIVGRCIWDFATVGQATPGPPDPPKVLVIQGLYQYVRNPLFLGVLALLAGETIFFNSLSLLRYMVGYWVSVHLIVVWYEEPCLLRKFGQSYEQYHQTVNRWIPARAYTPSTIKTETYPQI